jgi:hypothetical protein
MGAIKAETASAGLDRLFEPKASAGDLSDEDKSKDAFFVQVAEIAEAMSAKHGKEFAMGTLVLSARFLAEGRPLIKRNDGEGGSAAGKPS